MAKRGTAYTLDGRERETNIRFTVHMNFFHGSFLFRKKRIFEGGGVDFIVSTRDIHRRGRRVARRFQRSFVHVAKSLPGVRTLTTVAIGERDNSSIYWSTIG